MIYLAFSIISSVLVAVVIHRNEDRELDRLAVMLFNYLTAALLSLIFSRESLAFPENRLFLPLGFITGFIFVTAFVVYMISVRRMGLAIPVTVTRLSVVIPVLGSVIIFREILNFYQGIGLFLAFLAIYLFSWNPAASQPVKENDQDVLLPVFLFLLMGSGDFSLKIFQENFSGANLFGFVFLVFSVSAFYTLLIVLFRRVKITRQTIVGGILLGIPNFASAFFILRVLQLLPGSIAFPLNNIGIILLSTFTGVLFWKERLRKVTYLALGIAILAVLLLNTGELW